MSDRYTLGHQEVAGLLSGRRPRTEVPDEVIDAIAEPIVVIRVDVATTVGAGSLLALAGDARVAVLRRRSHHWDVEALAPSELHAFVAEVLPAGGTSRALLPVDAGIFDAVARTALDGDVRTAMVVLRAAGIDGPDAEDLVAAVRSVQHVVHLEVLIHDIGVRGVALAWLDAGDHGAWLVPTAGDEGPVVLTGLDGDAVRQELAGALPSRFGGRWGANGVADRSGEADTT